MPAALASVTAMGASLAMRASKSSGVMINGSTPSLASFSFTDGSESPLTVSWWMRATVSRGVFLGTTMPIQKSKSESGKPASTVVGTSGNAEERSELALPDEGERRRDRGKVHVHAAGDYLGERFRRALERNDLPLETGGEAEALHGQMRRRADAGGRVVDRAGLGLGRGDEF